MNKKMSFLILCLMVVYVCTVGAQAGQRGGYTGPSISATTIQEAKQMKDKTPVALEGKIDRRIGNKKYVFNDGKNTIIVEIDNDVWRGLSVGAEDVVIIYGEVEKNFGRVEIEVDRIVKK
jgi:uncharacterized protein (TIGR00156 family)